MPDLLIVNADDWGYDDRTTDAIAACFTDGLITSATAMVFMTGSVRAAGRAAAVGVPLGLHLNLSEPYTAGDVPAVVRARQARLARLFSDRGRQVLRWLPLPGVAAAVDAVARDQLAEFARLHGVAPTHVDGHKHVQVSPSVGRVPALRGFVLRRAFTAQTGRPDSPPRAFRHRAVLLRPTGTQRSLAIADLGAELRAGVVPSGLQMRDETIEVMAHPGNPAELELLRTRAWRRAVTGVRLGTYADLT